MFLKNRFTSSKYNYAGVQDSNVQIEIDVTLDEEEWLDRNVRIFGVLESISQMKKIIEFEKRNEFWFDNTFFKAINFTTSKKIAKEVCIKLTIPY